MNLLFLAANQEASRLLPYGNDTGTVTGRERRRRLRQGCRKTGSQPERLLLDSARVGQYQLRLGHQSQEVGVAKWGRGAQPKRAAAQLMIEFGYKGIIAAGARFDDEVAALKEAGVHAAYNFFNEAGTGLAEHVFEIMEDQPSPAL